MSYEFTGKLVAKYDTVQRTETFKTREFVVEKSEDIGGRVPLPIMSSFNVYRIRQP